MPPFSRVYLIDDDRLVNMINSKVINLADLTSSLVVYSSAREALEALRRITDTAPDEFPDIIFLDINMPDMDGWGFLDEFIQLPASIAEKCKVYMLTSSIDLNEMKKSMTYSTVRGFISKPITLLDLGGVVSS
jgi:CheY-like chemotaxis protein